MIMLCLLMPCLQLQASVPQSRPVTSLVKMSLVSNIAFSQLLSNLSLFLHRPTQRTSQDTVSMGWRGTPAAPDMNSTAWSQGTWQCTQESSWASCGLLLHYLTRCSCFVLLLPIVPTVCFSTIQLTWILAFFGHLLINYHSCWRKSEASS